MAVPLRTERHRLHPTSLPKPYPPRRGLPVSPRRPTSPRRGDTGLPAGSPAVVELLQVVDQLLFTGTHQRGTVILTSST